MEAEQFQLPQSATAPRGPLPGGAVCGRVEACRMRICVKAFAFEGTKQQLQESIAWLRRVRTRGPHGQHHDDQQTLQDFMSAYVYGSFSTGLSAYVSLFGDWWAHGQPRK